MLQSVYMETKIIGDFHIICDRCKQKCLDVCYTQIYYESTYIVKLHEWVNAGFEPTVFDVNCWTKQLQVYNKLGIGLKEVDIDFVYDIIQGDELLKQIFIDKIAAQFNGLGIENAVSGVFTNRYHV